ncbi:HTH domain-containing protein [Bifidobacterium callimiconis]|uniref:Uncharacterized protein n=1 Tax=Bifidobacterium callimiconis TaxID=2306973 RepID=A0A430FDJ5_9BIFI|nr:HTH domain-containing protein [Bifidobacterium callimiconis]RSX50935.1 hypothetical protein D2E23_1226 [Bifidobacterium callimiconis]
MRTGEFTQEEITYLRSLRAVARVSNGRIRYTEEFKRECMRRYAAGESPARIFRDAGLDSALIGYKRIERCISRWRGMESAPKESSSSASSSSASTADNHAQTGDDYSDEAFSPNLVVRSGRRDLRDLLIAQQVRRIAELEHEVAELRTEVLAAIDHSDGSAGRAAEVNGLTDLTPTPIANPAATTTADSETSRGGGVSMTVSKASSPLWRAFRCRRSSITAPPCSPAWHNGTPHADRIGRIDRMDHARADRVVRQRRKAY